MLHTSETRKKGVVLPLKYWTLGYSNICVSFAAWMLCRDILMGQFQRHFFSVKPHFLRWDPRVNQHRCGKSMNINHLKTIFPRENHGFWHIYSMLALTVWYKWRLSTYYQHCGARHGSPALICHKQSTLRGVSALFCRPQTASDVRWNAHPLGKQ